MPSKDCCRRRATAVTLATVTAVSLIIASPRDAVAQPTYEVLYDFVEGAGNPNDLVHTADGKLYGTTYYGGTTNSGTVFTLTPSGTLTILHSFSDADGRHPLGGLVQASDGQLYGTTYEGGAHGFGTIFRITSEGTLTTLHSFDGANGSSPAYMRLIQGNDGDLYGATSSGGSGGYGTVFRMTLAGSLIVLHSFDNSDGAYVFSGVIQGADGALYGTTQSGAAGYGTLFKVTTTGVFQTLHSFNQTDGGSPFGRLAMVSDGSIFGTTSSGGTSGDGTVFRLGTDGLVTTNVHQFAAPDANGPFSGLTTGRDGNLYGATLYGSTDDWGAIFQMTPAGSVTNLHSFNYGDGAFTYAPLVEASNGVFYGATSGGGSGGSGVVFRLTLTADSDSDGIPDSEDNCPEIANPDQADGDGDGIGNACDANPNDGPAGDLDGDGAPNDADNCPVTANPDQADGDGDGIGNACDANLNDGPLGDLDGDGVVNIADNCVTAANPSQTDSDHDGVGDVCDSDFIVLFVSNRHGNDEIYALIGVGGAQVNLTNNSAFDIMPALSPNRDQIAFSSNRDGNFEIYLMNTDGSQVTRLTSTTGIWTANLKPTWAPDGTSLAFVSTRTGNAEIFVMNANGTNQVNITNHPAQDFDPDWSPLIGGVSRIAFSTNRDRNFEIYLMDTNGGHAQNFTRNSAEDFNPDWKSGGSELAFVSTRGDIGGSAGASTTNLGLNPSTGRGDPDVFVQSLGSAPAVRQVTRNKRWDIKPAWSPNGSELAFASDVDGDLEIVAKPPTLGGTTRKLTSNTKHDRDPDWGSPTP